ncbi:MAG: hypothetical protein QOI95_295 [Acidimicrobiaceae bacterium]|jgi:hypothetical protein
MATVPERLGKARDPEDDARARAWAAEVRRQAEDGTLPDEGEHLTEKLAEEKARLECS